MDNTLEDLSQAIQNIEVDESFPRIISQQHLHEIRAAAIYLSAAIMDCLTVLIESIKQSCAFLFDYANPALAIRNALNTPDIDKAKTKVREKVEYYANVTSKIAIAMQTNLLLEKQENEILE